MTFRASLGTALLGGALLAATALAAQAQTRPNFNGIYGGAGVADLKAATCGEKVDGFAQSNNDRYKSGAVGGVAEGNKGAAGWITFEQDCGPQHRGRVSKPLYKPQYWEKVRMHDNYANAGGKYEEYADPQWKNYPLGVPRIGPPNQIVQVGDNMFFLYENQNTFRSIPTDCREHDPVLKYDQSPNGLAVGCWEGDTLVITTMGFTDVTWLDWPGYIHSNEMVVIEKLKLDGETLLYDVTVQDPVYFMQDWVWDTAKLARNKNPKAQLMQDVPYIDRSLGKLTDPNYRG
ncbi:hypothetical protein [Prosthecomicrobium sp. N25]|uniref:hypothetical protein n=1 Tax=Prosthecomicrobium sp. N25 TaxID=3129254 RepID=UPI0030781C9D